MRIIALAAALALGACQSTAPAVATAAPSWTQGEIASAETAIRAVLADQQAAWNEGDIDAFMAGYWNSPDLRFASGDKVTRGWQETLDRYKARYASRALMGTLGFEILEVRVFNPDEATVFGRWALSRPEAGDAGGLFTLMFRRIDGEWKIVSDHTS